MEAIVRLTGEGDKTISIIYLADIGEDSVISLRASYSRFMKILKKVGPAVYYFDVAPGYPEIAVIALDGGNNLGGKNPIHRASMAIRGADYDFWVAAEEALGTPTRTLANFRAFRRWVWAVPRITTD